MNQLTEQTPQALEDQAVTEGVHELVRAWEEGMPLYDVFRSCSGHDRYTATRCTPKHHPMFKPLMRMLDAMIAANPTDAYGWMYQTKHGTFSTAELQEAGAIFERVGTNGYKIVFPIRTDPVTGAHRYGPLEKKEAG